MATVSAAKANANRVVSSAELRRQARCKIATLSEDRLRVAVDFLAYLEDRESVEATEELLRIPNLMDDLRRAERDAKAARTVNWRQVRRDV